MGRDRGRDRWLAAAAGVSAVGLALGTGEVLAGAVDGVPSLVGSVGSVLIPFVPPALEDWAIAMFGTSDKLVLNAGTVVISLGIGAYAGAAGRRSRGTAAWLFGGLAGLGLLTALLQPLVSPLRTIVATVAAAAAGFGALWWLLGMLDRPRAREAGSPTGPDDVRRRLLGGALSVAITAVLAGFIGRSLTTGGGSRDDVSLAGVEPVRRLPPPPEGSSFGEAIDGLDPVVTPNEDFYRIDTALSVPRIDPDAWTMRVTGMVEQEVELGYSDLLGMDLIEAWVTLACVSNEVGDELVDNARWLGVRLAAVLDLAGVDPEATQIVGRAVDGWTAGFPTEIGSERDNALVAVGMNGDPLPLEHGFPARLVVPGLYGYVSATKWLTEIELTTWDGFDAYWVPRGWAKEGPIKTQSRIDVPRTGAEVAAGDTVVAGVAWAPHRGISRVEVRLDGGRWRDCELTEPLSQDAWRQWRHSVELRPGAHVVEVRATDGTGQVQPAERSPPRPAGATGHHRIRVRAT